MNTNDIVALEIRCLFHDRPLTLSDQVVRGDALGRKYEVYRFRGVCGCRVTFEKGQGPSGDKHEQQYQRGLLALEQAQIELRREAENGSS